MSMPDDPSEICDGFLSRIEDELLWQKQFEQSAYLLERLADEALADHRAEKTEELNPDEL